MAFTIRRIRKTRKQSPTTLRFRTSSSGNLLDDYEIVKAQLLALHFGASIAGKSIPLTSPCQNEQRRHALDIARKSRYVLAQTASSRFASSHMNNLESVFTFERHERIHKLVIAKKSPHRRLRLRTASLVPLFCFCRARFLTGALTLLYKVL